MSVAADPYPWPYDGKLDPRRLALVITGNQPAWVGASRQAAEVAEVIEAVAGVVRVVGGLVVHVRNGVSARRQGPSGPGERGMQRPLIPTPPADSAAWTSLATPAAGDLAIDAAGIDGFYGSPLDHTLRASGIDTLVFAGYGAEATVSSTLRSANDRGYECLTLIDAVAPFDQHTGHHALDMVTMSGGIFGAIALASAFTAALASLSPLVIAEAIS